MARPPVALPVLPVPAGPDPFLKPAAVAKQLTISAARFWRYFKRFPLLVSGARVVQAVEGGRGRLLFLQSYVTAHQHVEIPRTRDAAPVRPPDTVHVQRLLAALGRRVA